MQVSVLPALYGNYLQSRVQRVQVLLYCTIPALTILTLVSMLYLHNTYTSILLMRKY